VEEMGFLDFLFRRETPEKYIKEGDEFFRKNRFEEAISAYKKALSLDPNNKEVKNKLKEIYRERDTLKAVFSLEENFQTSSLQGSETGEISTTDRRKYVRVEDRRPIQYRLIQRREEEEIVKEGYDKNISEGGIFLIGDSLIPVGTFLEMRFDFPPPDAETIWVIGKVVRVQEIIEEGNLKYGMGIKFTNINPKNQERIKKYVEEQRKIGGN
jgi:tetratricopeptide (TPR) repeat protein